MRFLVTKLSLRIAALLPALFLFASLAVEDLRSRLYGMIILFLFVVAVGSIEGLFSHIFLILAGCAVVLLIVEPIASDIVLGHGSLLIACCSLVLFAAARGLFKRNKDSAFEFLPTLVLAGSSWITARVLRWDSVNALLSQLLAEDNAVWNATVNSQLSSSGGVPAATLLDSGGSRILPLALKFVGELRRSETAVNAGLARAEQILSTTQSTYAILAVVSTLWMASVVRSIAKNLRAVRPTAVGIGLCILGIAAPVMIHAVLYKVGALSGVLGIAAFTHLLRMLAIHTIDSPSQRVLLALSVVALALTWWPLAVLMPGFVINIIYPRSKSWRLKQFFSRTGIVVFCSGVVILCLIMTRLNFSEKLANAPDLFSSLSPIPSPSGYWLTLCLMCVIGTAVYVRSLLRYQSRMTQNNSLWNSVLGVASAWTAMAGISFLIIGDLSYGVKKLMHVVIVPLLLICVLLLFVVSWCRQERGKLAVVCLLTLGLLMQSGRYIESVISSAVAVRAGDLNPRKAEVLRWMIQKADLTGTRSTVCLSKKGRSGPEEYTLGRAAYYCSRYASSFGKSGDMALLQSWYLGQLERGPVQLSNSQFGLDVLRLLRTRQNEPPLLVLSFDTAGLVKDDLPSGLNWIVKIDPNRIVLRSIGAPNFPPPADYLLSLPGSL